MLRRLVDRFEATTAELAERRAAWRLRRRAAALPRDLDADRVVDFLLSEEAKAIVAWQLEEELRWLARLVAARRPTTVVEIGTADGGTLFAHARLAHEEASIISLDLPQGPFGGGYPAWRVPLYESFAGPRQKLVLLRVDSHSAEAERQLVEALDGRRIDYAFIDGDHTYDGVRQDFELCARHAAPDAIVAFHDVAPQPSPEWVESTDLAATDRTVHDFWLEVKQRFRHEECVRDSDQKGYGIGVLFLESPGTSDASEPDFASEGP